MRKFIETSKKNDTRTALQKERSRWEIVQDVLKVAKEENKAKKTRIMQGAYLDWRNFRKYFDFLLNEGFIANCGSDYYELTEKGEELIKRLDHVGEILDRNSKTIP